MKSTFSLCVFLLRIFVSKLIFEFLGDRLFLVRLMLTKYGRSIVVLFFLINFGESPVFERKDVQLSWFPKINMADIWKTFSKQLLSTPAQVVVYHLLYNLPYFLNRIKIYGNVYFFVFNFRLKHIHKTI